MHIILGNFHVLYKKLALKVCGGIDAKSVVSLFRSLERKRYNVTLDNLLLLEKLFQFASVR